MTTWGATPGRASGTWTDCGLSATCRRVWTGACLARSRTQRSRPARAGRDRCVRDRAKQAPVHTLRQVADSPQSVQVPDARPGVAPQVVILPLHLVEIGRASCRERV